LAEGGFNVGVVQAQGLSIALIIIATVLFLAAFFMRAESQGECAITPDRIFDKLGVVTCP
jgi:hypothetical protein